jgi:uncharacterized LabA/DUF88 family protein
MRSVNIVKLERVSILVDGGNFYHLVLKKLDIEEIDFDYDAFSLFIADGRPIVDMGKRMYVGTVREIEGDERTKRAMAKQTSFFSALKKSNWQIKTSKLRHRTEEIIIDPRVENYQDFLSKGITKVRYTRNREKGIDVKLATDLIVGAIDNQYDTVIVVSSDTDLIPAVDWVRMRLKKKIEYIGFSIQDFADSSRNTHPLTSMISHSDIQRTLIESDIRQFVIPRLIS